MSTLAPTAEGVEASVREHDATLHFPEALPGLAGAHSWELIEHEEARPFLWLRCLDRQGLSLLAVDPRYVTEEYPPRISPADLARIELSDLSRAVVLVIVNLDGSGDGYVNLRAPVVINPDSLLGAQVILDDPEWPMRHPLAGGREDAAGGTGRSQTCSSSAESQANLSSSAKTSE